MRAGGEKRGNNVDRARRKAWMLATFDPELGPAAARCRLQLSSGCVGVLNVDTITSDRIDPGGTYRHDNVQPACRPCQSHQGALITHMARAQWRAWMDEARELGIDWDGAL